MKTIIVTLAALGAAALGLPAPAAEPHRIPTRTELDSEIRRAMDATGSKGMAVAIIDRGRVVHVTAQGVRNAAGDPLRTDTVMYGASLTKAVFGYLVMQLVEEGKLDLDTPISAYLDKPLPEYVGQDVEDLYARWSDLAGDERWRKLTPRILLTHSAGFANFGFAEPDGKLKFNFEPGSRYSYSGDGLILLQFVIERGLGLDLEAEADRRIFLRFGMTRSSLEWSADFAGNLADGFDDQGKVQPHDERSAPRAAGSLDTTIEDMAKLVAGYVRGDGLSPAGRRELTRPQLPITTRSQFPVLQPDLPVAERWPNLAAGLAVITFQGPQGAAFFKGGGNPITANTWVCVEKRRRCVVILSNDARSRAAFPRLVRFAIGETGAPWQWEYPDVAFWEPAASK